MKECPPSTCIKDSRNEATRACCRLNGPAYPWTLPADRTSPPTISERLTCKLGTDLFEVGKQDCFDCIQHTVQPVHNQPTWTQHFRSLYPVVSVHRQVSLNSGICSRRSSGKICRHKRFVSASEGVTTRFDCSPAKSHCCCIHEMAGCKTAVSQRRLCQHLRPKDFSRSFTTSLAF